MNSNRLTTSTYVCIVLEAPLSSLFVDVFLVLFRPLPHRIFFEEFLEIVFSKPNLGRPLLSCCLPLLHCVGVRVTNRPRRRPNVGPVFVGVPKQIQRCWISTLYESYAYGINLMYLNVHVPQISYVKPVEVSGSVFFCVTVHLVRIGWIVLYDPIAIHERHFFLVLDV